MIPLHNVTDLNSVNNQKKVFFEISRYFCKSHNFFCWLSRFLTFKGWQVWKAQDCQHNEVLFHGFVRYGIAQKTNECSVKTVVFLQKNLQDLEAVHKMCLELREIMYQVSWMSATAYRCYRVR